jgi:thiol-disulfide isomerase/thioredoxin
VFTSRIKVAGAALLCLLLAACGRPEYHTLDGGSGRFSDFQGRWLLINYWAEWCQPCITELPELNEFQRDHAERATVFVVNYDGVQGDALVDQVQRLGIEVAALTDDPAPLLGYERPRALPSTFVINPDGKLHTVLQGPQTVADLAAAIGIATGREQP